jgi:hypothetical protein
MAHDDASGDEHQLEYEVLYPARRSGLKLLADDRSIERSEPFGACCCA